MPSAAQERILYLLKTEGAMTAQQLGERLEMTAMGARQHLTLLCDKDFVSTYDKKRGKGRPARYWYLTAEGHTHFPDRHADLTITMLEGVRLLFGDEGLQKLVMQREQQQLERYQKALNECTSLEQQVHRLAELRRNEGYMAEVTFNGEGWLLTEHHCPICSAAEHCQSFCDAELEVFQTCLGQQVKVDRTQHLINGDKRCSYFIRMNHTPEEIRSFMNGNYDAG